MSTRPESMPLAFETHSHSGNDQQQRQFAEARARGYARGWAHGAHAGELASAQLRTELSAAIEQSNSQTQSAVLALAAAVSATNQVTVPAAQEVLDTVLMAALDFAEVIMGHELAAAQEPAKCTLRRALNASSSVQIVKIRMNPGDAEMLTAADKGDGLVVVPDASVAPGDAIVEHPHGRIEVLLQAALERAREELQA